jgi:hypothetical protein
MKMKIDQIAYYAHNEYQVGDIMDQWGLGEKSGWIYDDVVGVVNLPRFKIEDAVLRGRLRFNYTHQIGLEILTYIEGPHWHMFDERYLAGEPFISHVGCHVEPDQSFQIAGDLVQTMDSISHTNAELVASGRKYYYEIIDTRPTLFHYTKLIWRR